MSEIEFGGGMKGYNLIDSSRNLICDVNIIPSDWLSLDQKSEENRDLVKSERNGLTDGNKKGSVEDTQIAAR
jgi:hypothetical protein